MKAGMGGIAAVAILLLSGCVAQTPAADTTIYEADAVYDNHGVPGFRYRLGQPEQIMDRDGVLREAYPLEWRQDDGDPDVTYWLDGSFQAVRRDVHCVACVGDRAQWTMRGELMDAAHAGVGLFAHWLTIGAFQDAGGRVIREYDFAVRQGTRTTIAFGDEVPPGMETKRGTSISFLRSNFFPESLGARELMTVDEGAPLKPIPAWPGKELPIPARSDAVMFADERASFGDWVFPVRDLYDAALANVPDWEAKVASGEACLRDAALFPAAKEQGPLGDTTQTGTFVFESASGQMRITVVAREAALTGARSFEVTFQGDNEPGLIPCSADADRRIAVGMQEARALAAQVHPREVLGMVFWGSGPDDFDFADSRPPERGWQYAQFLYEHPPGVMGGDLASSLVDLNLGFLESLHLE